MKYKSLHIILFSMLLPILAMAQEEDMGSDLEFYYNLGVKDAKYELSLESVNSEDEKDFWLDQMAFENRLKEKNSRGYQVYLNGKSKIYRQHQLLCGNRCEYSPEFSNRMAYYITMGELNSNHEVVYSEKTKKIEPKQ